MELISRHCNLLFQRLGALELEAYVNLRPAQDYYYTIGWILSQAIQLKETEVTYRMIAKIWDIVATISQTDRQISQIMHGDRLYKLPINMSRMALHLIQT